MGIFREECDDKHRLSVGSIINVSDEAYYLIARGEPTLDQISLIDLNNFSKLVMFDVFDTEHLSKSEWDTIVHMLKQYHEVASTQIVFSDTGIKNINWDSFHGGEWMDSDGQKVY